MKSKIKEKTHKIFYLSLIIFVIAIFTFTFNAKEVSAVGNCCAVDTSNNFCQDDFDGECKSDYYLLQGMRCISVTNPDVFCKVGTCVPLEGKCLGQKTKIECMFENQGTWYAGPKSAVNDCKIACCNVVNRDCSLQEEKYCKEDLGGTFLNHITNAGECNLICQAEDVGCCKKDNEFYTLLREECSETGGTFFNNLCSQVTEAIMKGYKPCTDIRPGEGTTDDDEFDCYCYDNHDNSEGIATASDYTNLGYVEGGAGSNAGGDCNAEQICDPFDKEGGEPATCVSINCVDEGDCEDCKPNKLRSGESVCVNVLPGHFNPGARSSYLTNYVLRCQYGEIIPDFQDDSGEIFDENRANICEEFKDDDDYYHGRAISNKWEECLKCSQSGFTDSFGFIPLIGPPIAQELGKVFYGSDGGICSAKTYHKCTGRGDGQCDGGNGLYDNDLWAPIGSCNPRYPPGEDKCDFCGKGGDRLTNVCTEEECEHLGDCRFEPASMTWESLTATGGVMAGGCVFAYVAASAVATSFPPLGKAAYKSAGEFCASLIGFGSGWPVYVASAYMMGISIGAAKAAEIKDVQTYGLMDGEKVKLGYALVTAKSVKGELEEVTPEIVEGLSEYRGKGFKNWWSSIFLNDIGSWLIQWKAGGGVGGAQTVLPSAQLLIKGIVGRATEAAVKNTIETQAAEVIRMLGENIGATEILKKEGLNPLIEVGLDAAKDIPTRGIDEIKVFESVVTEEAKEQATEMAGEEAERKIVEKGLGGTIFTAMKIAGAFMDMFSAQRALNPGKCVPEGKHGYTEAEAADNKICENCGAKEGQWYCTEKRCKFLASNCEFLPIEGEINGKCITKDVKDKKTPVVTKTSIEFLDRKNTTLDSKSADSDSLTILGELPYNITHIKLTVETDEDAKCRYINLAGQEYADMAIFDNESVYPKTHAVDIELEGGSKLNYKFFVKCEDIAGNHNNPTDDRNYVEFTLKEGPDTLAPSIEYIRPINGNKPMGTTTMRLSILTYDKNKVKECRYSTEDVEWENMQLMDHISPHNTYECQITTANKCDLFRKEVALTGGKEYNFTNTETIKAIIHNFHFVCEDEKGNKGMLVNSIHYDSINRSIILIPGFNVTLDEPSDGDVFYDRDIEIKANTTRETICTYKLNEKNYTFDDPVGGIKKHSIIHRDLELGTYNLVVACEDIAQNTDSTPTITFYVREDLDAPIIVRAYNENNLLKIVTNEESECRYDIKDCNFDFDTGKEMPPYSGKSHSALWNIKITYHIKCKDKWDRTPADNRCSINGIIKLYSVA